MIVTDAIPITNYGTAIAHMNGILRRSMAPIYGNQGKAICY